MSELQVSHGERLEEREEREKRHKVPGVVVTVHLDGIVSGEEKEDRKKMPKHKKDTQGGGNQPSGCQVAATT